MKQKFLFLLLIGSCLTSLTSCWDSKELNELAVVVGMAIDKAEDDYRLSVQIVNSGEINPQLNPSGAAPIVIRSETGPTIYEANRKTSMSTPKRVYVSHLRVLVISEEVAKDGITEILDLISRDRDFRTDFIVIVAKDGQAVDILKVLTTLERIPANQLYESLKNSNKVWAEAIYLDFNDLLKTATVAGKSIALSGIELIGDIKVGETKENTEKSESPARLAYTGIAIFDKTALIGWLDSSDGKGFSYITNQIKNTVEHLNCAPNEKMSIEIKDAKTKLNASINENKQPKITIKLNVNGVIGESNCSLNLSEPKSIKNIEKLLEEEITKDIKQTIEKVQKEYAVDVFGFGQAIRSSYPNVWHKLKDDWQTHFSTLDNDIQVNANINKVGSTNKSIKDVLKE